MFDILHRVEYFIRCKHLTELSYALDQLIIPGSFQFYKTRKREEKRLKALAANPAEVEVDDYLVSDDNNKNTDEK